MIRSLTIAFQWFVLVVFLICVPRSLESAVKPVGDETVSHLFIGNWEGGDLEILSPCDDRIGSDCVFVYDPVSGVFLYAYCHNDPVGKVDVLGLEELHPNAPSVYELQSKVMALNNVIAQEEALLEQQWDSLISGNPDLSISVSAGDYLARKSQVQKLSYTVGTHLLIGENGYRTEHSKKTLLNRYGSAGVYDKEIRNLFRGVTQPETILADRHSAVNRRMHQLTPEVGLIAIDLAMTGPVPTFTAGRLGVTGLRQGNRIKNIANFVEDGVPISTQGRSLLNSGGDSLQAALGPARLNNVDEYGAIMNHLRQAGVEIDFRPGQYAYGPRRGAAGNLVIDKDASISALRHEYGHFLDDLANGQPGLGAYLENPYLRLATERRQYLREVQTARQLGEDAARRQLLLDYLEEKAAIFGR